MSTGIWWRILPIDDYYNDISVEMGVDYEDLLQKSFDEEEKEKFGDSSDGYGANK